MLHTLSFKVVVLPIAWAVTVILLQLPLDGKQQGLESQVKLMLTLIPPCSIIGGGVTPPLHISIADVAAFITAVPIALCLVYSLNLVIRTAIDVTSTTTRNIAIIASISVKPFIRMAVYL